jgi:hypothetical protein
MPAASPDLAAVNARLHPTAMRRRAAGVLVLTLLLIGALPLLGLAAAGHPVSGFLEFPPRTGHVAHAPFAWTAFALMSLPVLAVIALYLWALGRGRPEPAPVPFRKRLPWWGWLGAALIATGWLLAWNDIVPASWRRHTFTPLWLGYVLVMNALAYRRSERSLLTHQTGWLLSLFPLSAVFWWAFEHLNQFTGNWYYTGVAEADGWSYFLQAALPFSTVLPAVASTWSWLKTFPRLNALPLPPLRGHPALAWASLAAGTLLLAGLGVWPEALFSMVWVAPLLILAGLQPLLLGRTMFAPLRHGDWRPVLQPALAALVCGFFWELWNAGSLAQWHYSIPYAQRFHVFEMPLLGYGGYLPFGVECALVMDVAASLFARPRPALV